MIGERDLPQYAWLPLQYEMAVAAAEERLAAADTELAETKTSLAAADAELAQTQARLTAADAELAPFVASTCGFPPIDVDVSAPTVIVPPP